MPTESDHARSIAERVARRVSQDVPNAASDFNSSSDLGSELAAMRAGLGELQKRLSQIENRVRSVKSEASKPLLEENTPIQLRTHSPWLAGVNAGLLHPSQERFGVEEATVTELVDFFQGDKQCTMEPGGKPCDHCAMCSSRGF